jgi:hypothetical protein
MEKCYKRANVCPSILISLICFLYLLLVKISKYLGKKSSNTFLKSSLILLLLVSNKISEIWDAEILKDNTIRFKSPEILFDTNSSKIKELFKNVLDDFFPRYLEIFYNVITIS